MTSRVRNSATLLLLATAALAARAQARPPSELYGKVLKVERGDGTFYVRHKRGGIAEVTTPAGRDVTGRWRLADGNICYDFAAKLAECWSYRGPLRTGKAVGSVASDGRKARITLLARKSA